MRFISASQIFSGIEFFKDPMVLVLNSQNQIEDIISINQVDSLQVEHYDGILLPGFVNTHCHLELSHLKNQIRKHTGIVDFALQIINKRNYLPEELQIECMQQADKLMYEQGIVAVGDISNSALSAHIKKNSSLHYHTFVELISLNPEKAESVFEAGKFLYNDFRNQGLAASLAPHAPYSVSLKLIKLVSDFCRSNYNMTSIHNQESKAENDFFKNKSGDFLKLYQTLNIPIEYFNATQRSSLQSFLPAIHSSIATLLVHNTFTDVEDLLFAKQHTNLFWCMCPQANLYIENTLPNLKQLIHNNCMLTIGTDSLASNENLSVMDEVNCILNHQQDIHLEILLKAATYNGACFLGKESVFGSFCKGLKPGINLIKKEKQSFIVKKIA